MPWGFYRGLNNYLYYVGGSLLELWYIPLNPSLIIEASTVSARDRKAGMCHVLCTRGLSKKGDFEGVVGVSENRGP